VAILLTFVGHLSYAQDSMTIDDLFSKGNQLILKNDYLSADQVFLQVTQRDTVSPLFYLYAIVFRTLCQYSLDEYTEMYELISFAETEQLRLSLSENTYLSTDIAYFSGLALFKLGYTYEALAYFQNTIKLYDRFSTFDFRAEDLYSNTAICYLDIADYDNAIIYLNKSINSESENHTKLDKIQWIGLKAKAYQYKGKLDLAETYYEEAFKLLNGLTVNESNIELQLNDDWSSFLIATNRFKEAEATLRRVETMNPIKVDLINYYQNKGSYFLHLNDLERSIDYFSKATEEAIALYSEKHYEVSDSYLKVADAFYGLESYEDALRSYTSATNAICLVGSEINHDSEIPDVNNILIHKLALQAQFQKAIIYSKQGNYELSKTMSRSVLEILDYMLTKQIVAFGSRIDFVNHIRTYVAQLIKIALDNGDDQYAFELSQKGHGLLLDMHIKNEKAKTKLIRDTSYLAKELSFKKELRSIESGIVNTSTNKSNELRRKRLQDSLFSVRNNYNLFLKELYNKYPQIYDQYKSESSSIDDLKLELNQHNDALIEYFIADTVLYSFVICNNVLKVYQKEIGPDFYDAVKAFRLHTSLINLDSYIDYIEIASELFDFLLRDILIENLSQVNSLVIVPDDILYTISFDALLTDKPISKEINRYDRLSYLAKDYSISYHYSSLLLKGIGSSGGNGLSSFAPSFSEETMKAASLEKLINNIDEVLLIDQIYKGEVYLDSLATKGQFQSDIKDINIAHLATHASCNDSLPMESRIFFSDQSISTYEIYNLPHNLDLVVLSACETGKGQIQRGEGVMSLARAFIASGAQSVITSLWNVNDNATISLMQTFYQYLSEGQSIQSSLHQSKKEYITNTTSIMDAHPYYWSGFILIGDDVIFTSNYRYWIWIAFGFIVLMIIVFYYLNINRRKKA